MSQSILNYLPDHEDPRRKLEVKIGMTLFNEVNHVRMSRRLTWNELVTGLFEKLADDVPPRDPPSKTPKASENQMNFLG